MLSVSWWEQGLRLLLAVFIGCVIGIERERKNRPAGFRTYMLTALGATLTVLLSLQLDQMLHGPWRALAESIGATQDVSRFGAEAAKGIGFLGAGTIIITARQQVKGLTTAAGIWATSGVGLAIGAGMYIVGVFATLMIIVLQVLLHKRLLFLEGPQSEQISITMERGLEPFQMLRDNLESINVQILEVKTQKNKDDTVSLELAVRVDQSLTVTEILACFQENPYIRALDI